jgi:uncharacterized protein with FMN-binding domain
MLKPDIKRGSRAGKFLLSTSLILASGAYIRWQHSHPSALLFQTHTGRPASASAVRTAAMQPAKGVPVRPSGLPSLKDGQYTGAAEETQFGDVQVKVTVQGGVLVDANCVACPDHRTKSSEITKWAAPMLAQETIQAQSANIDIVAQASFTSDAYKMSLTTALTKARK